MTTPEGARGIRPGLAEDAIPEEWKPGDVYLDRYEVLAELGQGAMGKVYKILHRGWNQLLAVKSPKRETIEAFGGAQCFEHECETWIRVGIHPNTVACYYARRLGGIPRVFAEYVNGRTLHEWIYLKKLYTGDSQADLRKILLIVTQIAWGLNHAHKRGVIHQDIKPANIMMTLEGTPKVTDFGLARRADSRESHMDSTLGQTTVGITGMTPAYCSPEQAFRDHITHRTDLWSWALVVFEMFALDVVWPTGSAALEALDRWTSRTSRRPELPEMPPRLTALLRQCFQSNPSDRPAGFDVVSRELISIYEELTQQPFPLMEPPMVEATGDTLNNRAISLMDFGKQERALKVWERALREAPGHPQSAFNYSLLRWRNGAITDTEALASIRAARESRPEEPLPVFLELRFHLERGDAAAAAACLSRIDEVAPEAPGLDSIRAEVERLMPLTRGVVQTWEAHQGAASAMLLDYPTGRLFTGGEDNRVLVWQLEHNTLLATLDGHTNTITALAYSPGRKLLASASLDRRLRIWDPVTGDCLHTHTLSTTRPRALAWLEERNALLVGDTDGTLHEVSVESGLAQEPLSKIPGGLRELLCAPTQGLLFAAAPGGNIHVLSMADFSSIDCLRVHTADITALALSPDGEQLASCDTTGALIISATQGGAHIAALPSRGENILAVAFAGSARQVLTLSSNRTLRLWHPSAGRCLWTLHLPAAPAPALVVSPDGSLAWIALANNTVLCIRISAQDTFDSSPLAISQATDTGEVMNQERDLRHALSEAAAHYKDGRYGRAASGICRVRQFAELSRRREVLSSWMRLYAKLPRIALRSVWEGDVLRGHHGPVRSLVLSLQANYLMSGGSDATIRLWDLTSGKPVRQFSGHAGPIRTLALGDSQEWLASASDDGTLKIWNVRTGRCERTLQHPGGAPEAMALSPDGRILATAGWELHFWDLRLGTRVAGIAAHEGGCTAVAWARSGRFVVSGGADSRIAFWDPETGNRLGTRSCPHGPVTALSLSPFESMLVSSGGNAWDRQGKACVWDVAEGAPARLIEAHAAPIGMAALTLDNRFVFTAAGDGELHVHSVTGEHIRTQSLGGASPGALALANDASRLIWSDTDGALRSLHFDWELKPLDTQPVLDAPARKLFSICALGLRPFRNRLEEPAPAGSRQTGWPLHHETLPRLDGKTLQRINYLTGCAGLGTHTPPALEGTALQLLESLKNERK